MRSNKERCEIIERTIKNIRSHQVITEKLIIAECRKNKISVKLIKAIGGGRNSKIKPLTQDDNEE
jgi:hypothetical protein